MQVTHYTSVWKWLQIKLTKCIQPRTPFLFDSLEKRMADSRQDLLDIGDRKFVVSIPVGRVKDWKKYELYDKLRRTTGAIQLNFPIENLGGSMVRDIFYTTPTHSKEVFGFDIYGLLLRGYIYRKELEQLYADYIQSSRPFQETDLQSVKVPEIWIPENIPLSRVVKNSCLA